MIFKCIIFSSALVLITAQHHEQRYYGHATSSQSIIRHDIAHNQHGYNFQSYLQPVSINSGSLTQYITPLSHGVSPVTRNLSPISYNVTPLHRYATIANVAPVAHSLQPLSHYVAPVTHNVAPITHVATTRNFSPITYHAGPIVHHSPAIRRVGVVSNYATPAINLHLHNQYHTTNVGYTHGHQDYYAHPRYEFEYSVQDTHTGDINEHESRDGDHVTGFYSLHKPDGSVRTVHYNVAGHSGFNAQVERTGQSTHVQPVRHYASQYALAHQ